MCRPVPGEAGKFDDSNPGENPGDPSAKAPALEQYLPSRYNEKTTLQAQVSSTAAENHFDFELKSEPPTSKKKPR